jgi:hypothetical protein
MAACHSALGATLPALQCAEEALQLEPAQSRAHFVRFCCFLERSDHANGACVPRCCTEI